MTVSMHACISGIQRADIMINCSLPVVGSLTQKLTIGKLADCCVQTGKRVVEQSWWGWQWQLEEQRWQ